MQILEEFYKHYPMLIQITVLIFFVIFVKWWLLGTRLKLGAEAKLPRQILFFSILITALITLVFASNLQESVKGQIISLIGIVLTGIIAFSSTTFVANAMSGLLLRLINSFKPGDFIKVNEQFGRVTERGLFHCEIQTEDRDLTTIPNLYLITNSVTIMHKTGTIVSVSLSLGYDIDHQDIEEILLQSAKDTNLTDPFVMVTQLGDFSITYKVAGFLEDVTKILTVRSNLRKSILSTLHSNEVEIVSPNFVNQRVYNENTKFYPTQKSNQEKHDKTVEAVAEDIMFDKAQLAQEVEQLMVLDDISIPKLQVLIKAADSLGDDSIKEVLNNKIEELKANK